MRMDVSIEILEAGLYVCFHEILLIVSYTQAILVQ